MSNNFKLKMAVARYNLLVLRGEKLFIVYVANIKSAYPLL
jgi:hypothetical protein